ncbi:MAG: isopenicillin N synthase family oxygenase, partial [Gammaproteobacteria bacterium]|nr:isopenicillin N synthase family oxygenase [Gammaproteobacteria bacterium]
MNSPIPVIDLQTWYHGDTAARDALCERLRQVCHEVGFFYLVNHGIAESVSAAYLDAIRAFFALPIEYKRAIDKRHSPQFRGWEQLGSELTNNQIDYREQIDIGVEALAIDDPDPWYLALIGPNQWPDAAALPGFRETVSDYFVRLSALSRQILRIMSRSLGLDDGHIEQVFG